MISFARFLLFPFSILYGIIIRVRHFLYDYGFFTSYSFTIPTICVGNVSVGGTGKTPMTEFLIHHLKKEYKIGVLSRGYRRKSKGFVLANSTSTVEDLGDEPFQFWKKYPDITLAVDGNRKEGVENLLKLNPSPEVIILDDAFQHRKVTSKVNIVLTSFGKTYVNDWLLPTGNLRDVSSRVAIADAVIITKCPENLSNEKQNELRKKLQKKRHQPIFFTTIEYADTVNSNTENISLDDFLKTPFHLVTGIANPKPLLDFLHSKNADFKHLEFPDHHHFSAKELEKLSQKKRVLTTEKDFVRLEKQLTNAFYIPIKTAFLDTSQADAFLHLIKSKL